MKKQVKKVMVIILAMVLCANFGVLASTDAKGAEAEQADAVITPYFVAISECSRGLFLESATLGELYCSGDTAVYDGYQAGVTVELQKLSGSWSTTKTWTSNSGSTYATVDKYYYVVNGTYRLKVTHRAYSGSTVVETFVAYSDTVSF